MAKINTTQPHTPATRAERGVAPAKGARKSRASAEATVVAAPRAISAAKRKNALQSTRETKLAGLVTMLREKRGASLDRLMKATGWRKHSVRGAISGAVKKKLGLKVVSEKTDGGRIYRIVG